MPTTDFPDARQRAQPGDVDEPSLWQTMRTQCPKAREALFSLHAGFARGVGRKVARERNRGDIDLADVDQAAYAGLLQSLDRFDADLGVPFRRFAARRITGAVIDAITRMSDMREQISWRHRSRMERLRSLQTERPERFSTEQALDALLELAVGLAVGFMLEGTALFDDRAACMAPNAYESAAWRDTVTALRGSLENLPERERSILSRHYFDGMAFEQIARLYGLSKGRISQLHRSALERLRRSMQRHGHRQIEQ